MKKRDKYLLLSMIAVIGYTVAAFILSFFDKEVPDVLTGAWFTFWATEIYHIARITIKDKDEARNPSNFNGF